jgi:hypothetical protein
VLTAVAAKCSSPGASKRSHTDRREQQGTSLPSSILRSEEPSRLISQNQLGPNQPNYTAAFEETRRDNTSVRDPKSDKKADGNNFVCFSAPNYATAPYGGSEFKHD